MLEFRRYNPDDFHDDGTVKVSPLMWLIVVYLSRHLLILMLGGLTTYMGSRTGMDTGGLSILYSSPAFLLASLPSLLVLVARLRRVAAAGLLVRRLWRWGRHLLILGAALDICVLAIHWHYGWLQTTQLQILGAFVDGYIITYLLRSARARDLFSDFPESTKAKSS